MDYNSKSIIMSDSLDGLFSAEMKGYVAHVFCEVGTCRLCYNGEWFDFREGDLLLTPPVCLVSDAEPTVDFRVRALYVDGDYTAVCTPRLHYGICSVLSLTQHPILRLTTEEQTLFLRDFDNVGHRLEHPHKRHLAEAMMTAVQALLIDELEFHDRIHGYREVSEQTEQLMSRFVAILEQGAYREHREVAWYASELCVTPKYLSECCRRTTQKSANFWINCYTKIGLMRLLRRTSLPLKQISDDFRFPSISSFTNYMEHHLGILPSMFRN